MTYVWYTAEWTYNEADKKCCHKEFVNQLHVSLPRRNRGWLGKFMISNAFYHAKWKHQKWCSKIPVWAVIQYSPNGSRSLAERSMLKVEKCTTLKVWGEIRQLVQLHCTFKVNNARIKWRTTKNFQLRSVIPGTTEVFQPSLTRNR